MNINISIDSKIVAMKTSLRVPSSTPALPKEDQVKVCHQSIEKQIQWNLSVTTTSIIKFITCDLFSNVF